MPKKSRAVSMDEPTIAEKLSSLEMVNEEKLEDKPISEPAATVDPPRADSLHVLLRQALRADDRSLLLECLHEKDEKVIAKSISHLNPASVAKLLEHLSFMADSRGAVMICVLVWIRTLLCHKASSIMLQESSLRTLNSLYQLLESRTSTYGSAVQLSCSLDLLLFNNANDETDDEGTEQPEPIIYENSDDEESEDAIGAEEEEGTDTEGLGDVTDAHESDESDVMQE
ncbi:WD repeat-containing protein 43-like [Zingiber officinale]|uniref:Small-subunit processome Utp12 domain-containing protein n=1 Tax=Zingiber officinale TaxID=94328 RepID=A0A8J5GY52_ZINOF|nr:WD repeat-containing protein 43-like [Zingiber officinale]KAG6508948.1 hypothetical protein ZIOFF_034330 [Zingiber officinale]